MAFNLSSPAFTEGGPIPKDYTCDGAGQTLPVAWSGVPEGTAELALIMDDPDARGFVHWVVVGIPPTAMGIEGDGTLPAGARLGMTGFRKAAYGGPCPPSGSHRYQLTLYALSSPLSLGPTPTADEVRQASSSHTLATATLNGSYRRGG
jgi:Raf kinase inhibitor-like YbhB/YbcL family protein